MTNLQKQIENLNNTIGSQLPQEILKAFADSIADLKAKGIENYSFKEGRKIPSFCLKSTRKGISINSDDLLNNYDKVILAFFRGNWCPYCNLELKALQNSLGQIEKKKVKLLAISPQKPEYSKMMKEENKLSYDILFDEDNIFAKQLGISFQLQDFVIPHYRQLGINLREFNGNDENSLPIPAVFVIDKNYKITYSFVDANYMNRINIDKLIKNL